MKTIQCFVVLFLAFVNVSMAQESMQQQFEGFNLVGYTDGGEKEWDINGETADVVGDSVQITNVDANSYSGEQELNLKARKGVVNRATGAIQLDRDVVITSETGAVMKTDSLDWDREGDLVTTPDEVILEDESFRIQGQGLEGHPTLKSARLEKDVQADIESETSEGVRNNLTITSDGPMELDQLQNKAVFYDNVVAYERETGRELKSDMMQVFFDPETRKIRQLVCTGNVVVTQDGNQTFSESLIYKADEQRMILSGSPKLILDTENSGSSMDFSF